MAVPFGSTSIVVTSDVEEIVKMSRKIQRAVGRGAIRCNVLRPKRIKGKADPSAPT
jgi:hypothetical protein